MSTPPFSITAEIGTANNTWGTASTFLDITTRAVSFNITRGRTDYTQPFGAGTGSFTFRNNDGFFDPDVPTGLAQGIKVGRQVIIASDPNTVLERIVYIGFITDITLAYDMSGQALCTFTTADALSLLAQEQIDTGTTFPAQTTRERWDAVLALPEIDYSFITGGSTGLSTCAAGSASGSAIEYLNRVITTEQGAMFVDREGVLTFKNRYDILNPPSEVFGDGGGTDTPYEGIERLVTATELYNRLAAKRDGGTTIIRESTTSVNRFGIRFLDLGDVLFASDGEVTDMLDYAMVRYASSTPRIESVTTNLNEQSAATVADLVSLDLTDSATVKFTPPGTVGITAQVTIQSISHQCTVGSKWLVTYGFTPRDTSNYFVLDDSTLGRLDQNVLSF